MAEKYCKKTHSYFYNIFLSCCQKNENTTFRFFIPNIINEFMNFEIFFQLGALLLVVVSGPLVVILLSARGGNL